VKQNTGDGAPRPGAPDEARHVKIVRPEIVPPLGEAVRLVKHPGADFPILESVGKGSTAKLLRRHEDQPKITQSQFLKHGLALKGVSRLFR
jgi:hypothetical protein